MNKIKNKIRRIITILLRDLEILYKLNKKPKRKKEFKAKIFKIKIRKDACSVNAMRKK